MIVCKKKREKKVETEKIVTLRGSERGIFFLVREGRRKMKRKKI